MDFLYKLYSNENFGIVLFIIISILVLAFLIVLFFGKKDQKERKLAETKKLELSNSPTEEIPNVNPEVAFKDVEQPIPLEVNVPLTEETIEPPMEETFQTPNMVLNSDLVNESLNTLMNEANKENQSLEVPMKEERTFDFDALAASISKELESIGNDIPSPVVPEPMVEQPKPDFIVPSFEQFVEVPKPEVTMPKVENTSVESKVERVEERRTTIPSPTQFSSVFVSKKENNMNNNQPIVEEKKEVSEPVIKKTEIPSIRPVEPMPVKPNIELPKPIDLPKLSNDPTPQAQPLEEKVAPIIEEKTNNVIFPNLERENPVFPNANNSERM